MRKFIILGLSIIIKYYLDGQNLEQRILELEKENKELKYSLKECMEVYILSEKLAQLNTKYPPKLSQDELIQEIKENHPYNIELAKSIVNSTTEFLEYCDNLKTRLVETTGGRDPITDKPIGCKNKRIVEQIMFTERNGKKLKKRIISLRKKFLKVGKKDKCFKQKITLKLKKHRYQNESWEKYNFYQMPMCAILPTITRIMEQAKKSEIETLEYLTK